MANNNERDIVIGGTYMHFKGHTVKVIDVAYNSETEEEMVVYHHNDKTWVRPKEMFLSKVDTEKYPDAAKEYRFELCEPNRPATMIKKAISGRQTGKTTKLIKLSAETGYPIVVRNVSDSRILQERAGYLGVKIPDPINIMQRVNNRLNGVRSKDIPGAIVDDAEYILKILLNQLDIQSVAAIAITTDDMNDELI